MIPEKPLDKSLRTVKIHRLKISKPLHRIADDYCNCVEDEFVEIFRLQPSINGIHNASPSKSISPKFVKSNTR